MWLATRLGFFSITVSSDDATKMQIRAREKGDLQSLCAVLGIGEEIRETPRADYRYRIIVEPEAVPRLVASMVKMIDYTNFKHSLEGTDQAHKLGAYTRVWAIMKAFQPGDDGPRPLSEAHADYVNTDDLFPRDEFRPEPFSVPCTDKRPAVARGKAVLHNPKAKAPRKALKPLRRFLGDDEAAGS